MFFGDPAPLDHSVSGYASYRNNTVRFLTILSIAPVLLADVRGFSDADDECAGDPDAENDARRKACGALWCPTEYQDCKRVKCDCLVESFVRYMVAVFLCDLPTCCRTVEWNGIVSCRSMDT
jgi:hypothetical protein